MVQFGRKGPMACSVFLYPMDVAGHRSNTGCEHESFSAMTGVCASGLRKGLALGAVAARLILPASVSADETPFIPPQATVVILVGLAGDVANEGDYHTQLTELLDLLPNQVSPPRQIFVLADNAETLAQSSSLPIKIAPATREQFLALGKNLSGLADPLVVIMWGHGGQQGQTPVFHLRGPRLTAADCREFAGEMPKAESRWLLFFRGSGAFAGALAGNNRSIISSEKETVFSNDPMAMPLALKILRANPAVALEQFGQELGRATSAWYDERHLARTEEPTLWTGTDAPRLLAPTETGDSLASAPAQPQSSSTLSPAWKEIKRVSPDQFPESDAVILSRHIQYTLADSPAIKSEQEEFIQILKPEGKRHGDFDVAYWPPQEDITFLDCEVLQPDGKLLRLDPDDIHEAEDESVGDYHTARRKIFSLPAVTTGAVLRVHYQSEWRTYPLPHVTLTIPLSAPLPIRDLSARVTLPRDSAFHFGFEQAAAHDPEIKQTTYGTSYAWHLQDVPAHVPEVLTTPEGEPSLLVSTFVDWTEFAEWYSRIARLADEVTPELTAKAMELTRESKTDRDKIQAIYYFVTNLRYIAIPLGVNSHRPHAAANVLRNQFGDCKDKANLFNTLLRSQGINANLVLVPRFMQAYDTLPGLAFNHAISRVTLTNNETIETIWVDTTDDTCPFGLLPPGDPGRRVLVVDGKSKALTQLPSPTADAHRLVLDGTVQCEGDAWPIHLAVTGAGFCDYDLRAAARELDELRSTVPILAVRFRPAAGAFAMTQQSFTPLSELQTNFSWQGEGTWTPVLAAPFWLPREWDLALHQRHTPLVLNHEYPLKMEQTVKFMGTPFAQTSRLPSPRENTVPPLRWKVEWKKTDDSTLVARLETELDGGEFQSSDTALLQSQLRALFTALAASPSSDK